MSTMLESKERYYSVRELARRLGVSKCRVHQIIRDRNVRTERIANILVIPESEVQRLEREERRPGRPKSRC
ncbi:hypothetical protein [Thermogutta sp.]|uniref:hypothetical protein n=1 Tax=Thermogutta sp. TaxID=1962930 RepID=UPI003220250A